jgi:hypothetical protein
MSTPTVDCRLENPKIGDVVTMLETSAESGGTPPHFHKTYAGDRVRRRAAVRPHRVREGLLARIARRRGVDRELERRYVPESFRAE